MATVNYGYFLFGIFIFFTWRLLHLINYFKRTPYPVPGRSSLWFFIFGSIYILVLINTFQNIDLAYGFDYLTLVPSILIVLAIINFWGESFIAPTKNYLIALGLGALVGTATLMISYYAFLSAGIPYLSSYFELIPILLGLLIGAIAGIIIYSYVLKARKPDWNTPLWHLNKFWDLVNHSSFLLAIMIFAVIEATLQLHSNSLFLLFTSF